MKQRTMAREDWPRVLKRAYVHDLVRDENFDGAIGLIRFDAVREPFAKQVNGRVLTLLDQGYYWLQMAPRDEHYWLTVAYDAQKHPVQWYFDVTWKNTILPQGQSYFQDLYLDVIITPGNFMMLLDEDELEEALAQGAIGSPEYDLAQREAHRIMDAIKGRADELEQYCRPYFDGLLRKIHGE